MGDRISGFFGYLSDKVSGISTAIIDGLKSLFIPDKDFLSEHIQQFQSHFGFTKVFSDNVEKFKSFKNSGTAPTIAMNLSASKSYKMSGSVNFIDLSFYAPYKETGDILVTGFVYLMFIWRFFSRLPEIIQGAGMVEVTSSKIDLYRTQKENSSQ